MPRDDKAAAGIKNATWQRCWKESRGHRVPQKSPNLAGRAGLHEEKVPALAPRPVSHPLLGDTGSHKVPLRPAGCGEPCGNNAAGTVPSHRILLQPQGVRDTERGHGGVTPSLAVRGSSALMGEPTKEVPGHPLPPTPGLAGCTEQRGRAEGLNKRGWSRKTTGVAVLEGPAASQIARRGSLGCGHEVEGSPLLNCPLCWEPITPMPGSRTPHVPGSPGGPRHSQGSLRVPAWWVTGESLGDGGLLPICPFRSVRSKGLGFAGGWGLQRAGGPRAHRAVEHRPGPGPAAPLHGPQLVSRRAIWFCTRLYFYSCSPCWQGSPNLTSPNPKSHLS